MTFGFDQKARDLKNILYFYVKKKMIFENLCIFERIYCVSSQRVEFHSSSFDWFSYTTSRNFVKSVHHYWCYYYNKLISNNYDRYFITDRR